MTRHEPTHGRRDDTADATADSAAGTAEEHDRGLSHDLPMLVNRRRALALLGGAGLAAIAACTPSSGRSGGSGGSSPSGAAASTGSRIPEETAGPYPGDGSNGPDALSESGIVRSDIRSSFGGATGVAEGVPLTVLLTVLNTRNGSAPLAGAAVYVWHCDREGRYSMYTDGATEENYLRGVQETDAAGRVRFRSIYPAAYAGRWPHVHFEVYPDVAAATGGRDKLRTSQLAFPEDACRTVYATGGYEQSLTNLSQVSLSSDRVFRDGWSLQLATVTGSADAGMTATLPVPV